MTNLLSLGAIAFFSILTWWSTRFLPFIGDAAAFVNLAAQSLRNTHFQPFIAIGSDFAHPPLWPALLGLITFIPGSYPLHAHLLLLPFIFIYLASIYFILKKLVNPLVGLCGAFILAFIPVVEAEFGGFNLDLPSAALALAAIALFLYNYWKISLVTIILAVFIKETALLFLPFFLLSPSVLPSRAKVKSFWLVPVFYVLWAGYHWGVTGWWFFSPQSRISQRYLQSLLELSSTVTKILSVTFWEQARFLILIGFGAALFFWFYKRRLLPAYNRLILSKLYVVLICFLTFYVIVTEYLSRYLLPILPIIIIIILVSLWFWLKPKFNSVSLQYLFLLTTLLVVFMFSSHWYPIKPLQTEYEFRPPADYSYLDHIRLFTRAAAFFTTLPPETPLIGSYPENFYFTDSSLGYLQTERAFIACRDFSQSKITSGVLVVHPLSPGQIDCHLLQKKYNPPLIGSFQSGQYWLDLYALSASSTATLSL